MAFDTRIYLGRPGALAAIRSPRGAVEATRQRRTSTFDLGLGGAAVDQMVGGARIYVINYDQLFREDWTTLQGFLDGHEGPGPFAFLDPGQRNMLPANMSAATSVTNGTDNFTVAGSGCTIASSNVFTDAGPRSLAWTFSNASPGASAAVYLTADWPSSWFTYGVPVVLGRPLCFSAWVRGGGTDAIVTYASSIIWRDASGVAVGAAATAGSGNVTSAAGAFAQIYATGTPPSNAFYADWKINYISGVSAGSIGYFRRFMLNEGTTPDIAFAHGTGVWPVRVVGGPETWPFISPELRAGPVFTLAEDVT